MLIKLVDSKQANEIILDFFIIFFPTHISATRSGVGVLLFMFLLVGTLLYVRPPLLNNKYKHNNNNTPTPDLVAEICVGKKL